MTPEQMSALRVRCHEQTKLRWPRNNDPTPEEVIALLDALDAERAAHAATRARTNCACHEGEEYVTGSVCQDCFGVVLEQADEATALKIRLARLDALLGDRERMGRLVFLCDPGYGADEQPWEQAEQMMRDLALDAAKNLAAAIRAALDGVQP